MKHPRLAAPVIGLFLLVPVSLGSRDGGNLVNAVLGNIADPAGTSEIDRIRTHLEAVANRLAHSNAPSNDALALARARNIERLRAYAAAEQFPHKPADIPGRIPNFLDDNGNVCAVGYLFEQDLGRDAVVTVARDHQFDYVPYIDSPALAEWQASSGLTVTELAMIQPAYGDPDPRPSPTGVTIDGYGTNNWAPILFLTGDVVMSIANFSQMSSDGGDVVFGFLGVMMGASSYLYGERNDGDAYRVGGAMSAAFGLASFAFDCITKSDNVSVAPVRHDNGDLGVVACVRF